MSGDAPRNVDAIAETHLGGAIMWVGGDGIMALVAVCVAVMWLRLPESRRLGSSGWLEQARRRTLAEKLTPGTADERRSVDVDADDAALAGYNAWLARLNDGND
jgi:putative copper resistance protein D